VKIKITPFVLNFKSNKPQVEANLTYVGLNSNHVRIYVPNEHSFLGFCTLRSLIQHRGHRKKLYRDYTFVCAVIPRVF